MELTFIGLTQIVFGVMIVLAGSANSALLFLIISALFDGSAAILLPALGGSSIPPSQFVLLFVFLRIFVPKGGLYGYFPDAVRANAWLLLFCIYGVTLAYIGPRLFGGVINVFPMRPDPNAGLFDVFPLRPTSQNLTAGIYMLGTLLLVFAIYILSRKEGAGKTLVSASILGGWFFVVTGLLDVIARGTPFEETLAIFRNGDYAQLSVEVNGFIRIRGLMPEASTYAGASFVFFVANAELWYRSVRTVGTGSLAAILGLILVFSTSSTAYVSLGGYTAFFLLRALAMPGLVPKGKIKRAATVAFWMAFFIAVTFAIVPELPEAIYKMVLEMTVEKSSSDSGQQRLFWAMQGLRAVVDSYGLGIGPGSFRSSSIFMAILGSMGVIGIASFILYLLVVLQPMRRSSWGKGQDLAQTLGGAFASTAVLSLIPAAVGSPQANPGALFSIFAGAALALRPALAAQSGEESRKRKKPQEAEAPAAVTEPV